MPSFGGLVSPATLAGGIKQSLALARAANPRAGVAPSSFDQHLDQALQSGIAAASQANSLGRAVSASANASRSTPPSGLDHGAASIEAIRAEYQTASAEFEELFRRLLREHNIELGDGVVLAANAQGEVQVAGQHPQKQAIEQLFRDDRELRKLFAGLDLQASLLRAADIAGELERLYSEAPLNAAERLGQLQSGPPPKFSLSVRSSEIVAQFS